MSAKPIMPLDTVVLSTISIRHYLDTAQALSTLKKSPFQNFKVKWELPHPVNQKFDLSHKKCTDEVSMKTLTSEKEKTKLKQRST